MKSKVLKEYIYAVTTGAFLALSFPPAIFPNLVFVAFLPLFSALEDRSWKNSFLLVYLSFFIYHAGANWWVGSWSKETDPYLMISGIALAIGHPFFLMVPIVIFGIIRRKFGIISYWLFPFVWVAFEYAHGLGDLSYPWLSIGYSQITNLILAQQADIWGVFGISFWIVQINVIFWFIAIDYADFSKTAKNKWHYFRQKGFIILAPALVFLFMIPLLYGLYSFKKYEHELISANNKSIRIAIVQPAINPWDKWSNKALGMIHKHKFLEDSLRKASGDYDLSIWSETAITYMGMDFNFKHNFDNFLYWIDNGHTPLVTGFTDIVCYDSKKTAPITARKFIYDSTKYYDAFNSAVIINPHSGSNVRMYHKTRLTPFSERIPYAEYMKFLSKLIEWQVGISSWQKGEGQKIMYADIKGDTVKIAVIICIESIYSDYVNKFTDLGAEILVIITNDAWYDHTPGPAQHFAIAQMRAIENRRYIARCANTGVSGFIQPNGDKLLILPQYKSIATVANVPKLKGKTIYAKVGDIVPVMASVITLLSLLLSVIFRKKL